MRQILKMLKRGSVILVAFIAFSMLSNPFSGNSNFMITTLYYALILFITFIIIYFKKITLSKPLLSLLAVVLSLYFSEVILRYIAKYPITYSEKQRSGYKTMYDSPGNRNTFFDRLLNDTVNKHLLIFPAHEERDFKTIEFNYTSVTNDYGLRGKLPSKNKKNIVTLGDSFTESFGAPTDSTYPLLLETLLSKEDTLINVLNGGVSGSDPFFEFQLLKKLTEKQNYYAAIFMVNSSDITDVIMRGGSERFLPNGDLHYRKAPWWEPLYAISFVSRLFLHELGGYNYSLMTQKQEGVETLKAVSTIAHYFDSVILPWTASKNIKVFVVLQPEPHETTNQSLLYEELNRRLSSLQSLQTCYFNLADSLRTIKHIDKYYWPMDGHFNSKGYELTAWFINETFFNMDIHNATR